MKAQSILLLLLLCFYSINCVYVIIKEGDERCLSEDLLEGEVLQVIYKCPALMPKTTGIRGVIPQTSRGVEIKVINPSSETIYFELIKQKEGIVKVNPKTGVYGDHKICFTIPNHAKRFFGKKEDFVVHVDTRVDSLENIQRPQTKQKMVNIEQKVKEIDRKVKRIQSEQSHYSKREKRFRQTTDSTYSRIYWMGIFSVIIVLSLGGYQMYSLKTFFKKKKIV